MSGLAGGPVRFRPIALGLLGLTLSLLPSGPVAAVPAQTSVAQQAVAPADDFGACVAGGGAADLILLVDESSSLLESDAELDRITSASYFVSQLAESVDDGALDVSVQVSVFGDSYSTLLGWTGLDRGSAPAVRQSLQQLADRVSGFDTDYWTALDGASKDLAARASARGAVPSCQGIVWFSDGKLDYFPRETEEERKDYGTRKAFAPDLELTSAAAAAAVREQASADLCRSGGLADQLRSSRIRLFAIGLSGATAAPGDFDILQSIATGTSPSGTACGALLEPSPGEFHLASDIDGLLLAFDTYSTPGTAPLTQETGICQVVTCADQAHRFVLDASTPTVRVLAAADADGLSAGLELPDGSFVELPRSGTGSATSLNPAGTALSYTWQSERTVSIDLERGAAPDAAWTGLWQFAFTDPAGASADRRSTSNIHISGALSPAVLSEGELDLRAGAVAEGVVLGMTARDGSTADAASILGDVAYTAVLQDGAGVETTILDTTDKSAIGDPIDIDLSDAAIGAGRITLRLSVTTASVVQPDGTVLPGTALEPAVVGVPVAIKAPATFPDLPSSLDFGRISGAVEAATVLTASGSGCVWIPETDATVVAAPDGLGGIRVATEGASTAADCRTIEGETELTVTLAADAGATGGNGTLNGTAPVMISSSDGSGEPLRVDVPFTASLVKPIVVVKFWIALIAAVLLGPGIPLLLLYAAKRWAARIPARPLSGAVIDVTVADGRVLRAGAPFTIGPADTRNTLDTGLRGVRRVRIGEIELAAVAGASPLGAGHVRVHAGALSSAGSAHPSTDRSGRRARLPLAVHQHWVLLHDPSAPADTAQVLVLVSGDATTAQVEDLVSDVTRRAPQLLTSLLAAEADRSSGSEDAPAPTGPFPGGSGAASPFEAGSPFGAGAPFGSGPAAGAPFGAPGPAERSSGPPSPAAPSGADPVPPASNPFA